MKNVAELSYMSDRIIILGRDAVILVPKRDESTQYSWSYKPGTDLYETAEIPVWVPVTARTKNISSFDHSYG